MKLALIKKTNDKYFGSILFDNAAIPTTFFSCHTKKEGLIKEMQDCFNNELVFVDEARFNIEIDYVKLFGERAAENELILNSK